MVSKSNKGQSSNGLLYIFIFILILLTVYLFAKETVASSKLNLEKTEELSQKTMDTIQFYKSEYENIVEMRERSREMIRQRQQKKQNENRKVQNLEKINQILVSNVNSIS